MDQLIQIIVTKLSTAAMWVIIISCIGLWGIRIVDRYWFRKDIEIDEKDLNG